MNRHGAAALAVVAALALACSHARSSPTPAATSAAGTAPASPSPSPSTAAAAPPSREPDVIYVPTTPEVVDEMLRLAAPKAGDLVYDLGCGDGRIVVTAAQRYGTRGIGIDIDPARVGEARANVAQAGVGDKVEIRQADLFETDFHDADVVTLYLLPTLNLRLRPKLLAELRPGTRVVSHAFDMGDWEPEQKVDVKNTTVFLWTIPERK